MQTRRVWILLSSLVLVIAVVATPAARPSHHLPAAFAQGDDDDVEIEPAGDDDDDDAGIEPGEGGGDVEIVPGRGEEGTLEPGPAEEVPIGDDDDSGVPPPVVPVGEFRVEVLCAFSADAGMSECAFTGMPLSSVTGDVSFLVPVDVVCAGLAGGQFEYVDPDPTIQLSGFRPVGSERWLTLILEGVVAPSGTATYWFQTDAGVFPATGPALACTPAPAGADPTPPPVTPTVTPEPSTGTLVVSTHTCTDVPENRSGYDWFGQCAPLAYQLVAVGTPGAATPETTVPAESIFEELAPGMYDLGSLGFTWCHARSDNVTSESEVVIEAGARTTVWIFLCDGSPAPAGT